MRAAFTRFQQLRWQYKLALGLSLSVIGALIFPPPNPPGTIIQGPPTTEPYTGPPDNLVMPHTWQLVMTIVIGAMAGGMLIYAIHVARKTSSPLPLLFWLGGLAAVFLEPVADVMGNVIHSPQGAWTVFTVEGHPIPWHVLLCYPWYFGGLPIFIFDRMRSRTVGKKFWWDHYLLVFILVPLIEIVPAHYGVWIYYGEQPFKIGATPDGMAAANVCAVMLPTLMIYMLLPKLKGWKQLLVVPLIPAFAMAGHAGAGVVLYVTLGQNTLALPEWVIEAAGITAIGMSLMIVWLMLELVYGYVPISEASPAPPADPWPSQDRRRSRSRPGHPSTSAPAP